jgi:nitrite reductase/ring-hydroxylating ferredoxin subunit
MRKLPPRLKENERKRYWKFFDRILTSAPSQPETDYVLLCEAWKEASEAGWIWLFLVDSTLGTKDVMQLVGASKGAPLPSKLRVENCQSVTTYCVRNEETVIINNPCGTGNPPNRNAPDNEKPWQKTDKDGNIYSIYYTEELKRLGCGRIVCVPLLFPFHEDANIENNPSHPNITGAICLYYSGPISKMPTLHVEMLNMMGLLSAQAILNSYQALQRDILLSLNEIAHKHLTSSGRPPRDLCKLYVSEVLNIIKTFLRVDGVSVFYRDSLRGGVQCLDSTGLVGKDGTTPIERENFSEINYAPDEGATGKCYRSGKAIFLVDGMDVQHHPKTSESIEGKSALELPAVIYPIHLAKGIVEDLSGNKSLGVIRCKYHHAEFSTKEGLCFDAIEIQTLDFIARQIAPILETFEVNISREAVVSITKHDLLAPLDFIRHRAFNPRYAKENEEGVNFVTINRHDLYDFGVGAMLALNLVRQFDADPSIVREAELASVSVEHDIIAPLKNMLAYYAYKTSQISIIFENLDSIPNLWLDEILIQRAFFNLLTNAIKYGEKRSGIRVDGRKSQAGYNIDVINEGIGVDAHDEPLIFQPGYRSPNVRHIRIGLGLGLPIARACVERCGGSLYLLARRNPTVFSVFFPKKLSRKHL